MLQDILLKYVNLARAIKILYGNPKRNGALTNSRIKRITHRFVTLSLTALPILVTALANNLILISITFTFYLCTKIVVLIQ